MSTNEEYIRKNKISTVDDDKNTKLHYSAATGNYEEVEKAIAEGQKIDPENYLGWTPLMMAVRNGRNQVVSLLLDHKADATKKNKFGMNIFLISVTSGDVDLVEKILNHLLCGGISRQSLQRIFSPISLAILFSQPQIFKYLIDRSFDINATSSLTGISPLMFAAAMGNHKAYRKLIQLKADVSLKNCLGKTAPEILQSRSQRVDIGINNFGKQKSPHVPLVVITSHAGPQLQLTPTDGVPMVNLRKSSNTKTPIFATPNITPISPHFYPQVFFPPDFSPGQFISPVGYQHQSFSNGILNATINQSTFFSPTAQQICHRSYV